MGAAVHGFPAAELDTSRILTTRRRAYMYFEACKQQMYRGPSLTSTSLLITNIQLHLRVTHFSFAVYPHLLLSSVPLSMI